MLGKQFSLGKMSVVSAKEYSDNPLLYKNKKKNWKLFSHLLESF